VAASFYCRFADATTPSGSRPAPEPILSACGYFSAPREAAMTLLKWALIFFVISIIAAIFGFGGVSAAAADIARILFYIFLVIFIILLVLGLVLARRL